MEKKIQATTGNLTVTRSPSPAVITSPARTDPTPLRYEIMTKLYKHTFIIDIMVRRETAHMQRYETLDKSLTCRSACEHQVARTQGELVGDEGEQVGHWEDHVPGDVDDYPYQPITFTNGQTKIDKMISKASLRPTWCYRVGASHHLLNTKS